MGESTNTRITLGNKLIRILEPFDDVVCNAFIPRFELGRFWTTLNVEKQAFGGKCRLVCVWTWPDDI